MQLQHFIASTTEITNVRLEKRETSSLSRVKWTQRAAALGYRQQERHQHQPCDDFAQKPAKWAGASESLKGAVGGKPRTLATASQGGREAAVLA